MRIRLAEFNDRVHSHVEAIISTQDVLRFLKAIFSTGDQVWPAECEDVIECLIRMRVESRKFHTFIERSNHLPLAVVSLRLPLLMALKDAEAQITKLNRILVALRNDSWITLDQSVEQVFEVQNELGILELKSEEILDRVGILLDRARFKEREYSIA